MKYRTNAPRGAKLLDEKRPGWAREVSMDKLNMMDGYICVLGQLYGNWIAGLNALFGGTYNFKEGTAHGFSLDDDDGLYLEARLNREWINLITRRRFPS